MTAPEDTKELRSACARLVEEFGRGWEEGKPDAIASVFSDGGTFVPGAFDPPRVGREAIAGYWKDIPLAQAEIRFRCGEIFLVGPWFATEFKCTFRRRRTGEPIDVRGALFCETEGGRISEMRMYWQRQ